MKIHLFGTKPAKNRSRIIRSSAARAARGEDEYYEAEPNMKLSHAFMVVLILHVVAVGGIYAFNYVKVSQKVAGAPASAPAPAVDAATVVSDQQLVAEAAPSAAPVASAAPVTEPERGGASSAGILAADPLPPLPVRTTASPANVVAAAAPASPVPAAPTAARKAPAEAASAPAAAAGGTYTVQKGDNPYRIARKFKVSYEELLKVNNVTDPTKLQIGQVLKLPAGAVH